MKHWALLCVVLLSTPLAMADTGAFEATEGQNAPRPHKNAGHHKRVDGNKKGRAQKQNSAPHATEASSVEVITSGQQVDETGDAALSDLDAASLTPNDGRLEHKVPSAHTKTVQADKKASAPELLQKNINAQDVDDRRIKVNKISAEALPDTLHHAQDAQALAETMPVPEYLGAQQTHWLDQKSHVTQQVQMWPVLLALSALMCAGAAVGLMAIARRKSKDINHDGARIDVLAVKGLGAKQRLMLVEVGHERLLLCASDREVTLLTQLMGDGADTAPAAQPYQQPEARAFSSQPFVAHETQRSPVVEPNPLDTHKRQHLSSHPDLGGLAQWLNQPPRLNATHAAHAAQSPRA